MDIMKIIDKQEFIYFLRWLDDHRGWYANEIISVVERPSGYQKQFNEYMEEKNA